MTHSAVCCQDVRMKNSSPPIGPFKPSDFMRGRRPGLFSDTVVKRGPLLTRAQLEYHLETLTARKQEIAFENFCRQLAQKEICPNLLPQTGPTGGGDSKADTQTYPVADALSLRWLEGVGREAAQERWAFAFSAKKDWRGKVESDVAGIVGTGRDYSLIYFITNQLVADKKRAAAEDEISVKYSIAVRILDRTWIVEQTLEKNHLDLASRTLDIDSQLTQSEIVPGPIDTARRADLEELERKIADPEQFLDLPHHLAEAILESALIVRGLGHPRGDVDGRFERTRRLAEEQDNKDLLIRILYQQIWTAYWWFDDLAVLDKLYDRIELLAIESREALNLERLTNLLQITRASAPDSPKLLTRFAVFHAAIDEQSKDQQRPANALWARSLRVVLDLPRAIADEDDLSALLAELEKIIESAQGRVNFPMSPLLRIIRETADLIEDSEQFDRLIEKAAVLLGERSQQIQQGQLILEHAERKQQRKKTYEAIRLYGRAQSLLAHEESRDEHVEALVGAAVAYEAAGLLWAARASISVAASIVSRLFTETGVVDRRFVVLLRKLVWLELQLGRVTWAMSWLELADLALEKADFGQERQERFLDERQMIDGVFSILVLKTKYDDLGRLDCLPTMLNHCDLPFAHLSSLFALGYEDVVQRLDGGANSDIGTTFARAFDQPANEDLPESPEWFLSPRTTIRTALLGCELLIVVPTELGLLLFSESLLASMESLASTLLGRKAYPRSPQLRCEVRHISEGSDLIRGKAVEDDCGEITIKIELAKEGLTAAIHRSEFQDQFHHLISLLISYLVVPLEEDVLRELFEEERALDRAYHALQGAVTITNVLSESPRWNLTEWRKAVGSESFSLLRSTPWVAVPKRSQTRPASHGPITVGEGEAESFGVDGMKHRDQRSLSVINLALWDRAKWYGVGVALLGGTPVLGMIFKNEDAGRKIFGGWQKRVDSRDVDELLRITIITGVDRHNPCAYRVAISTEIDAMKSKLTPGSQFMNIARYLTAVPADMRNLELFREAYARTGRYVFAPILTRGGEKVPDLSLGIEKRRIRFVEAWSMQDGDLDLAAITSDIDPVIPDGVVDPPIRKALRNRDEIIRKRFGQPK